MQGHETIFWGASSFSGLMIDGEWVGKLAGGMLKRECSSEEGDARSVSFNKL